MIVYANAKLISVEDLNFSDSEGKTVEYSENYLKTDNGLLKINSKASFKEYEEKEGLASIKVAEFVSPLNGTIVKGAYKLTLGDFIVGAKADTPEGTVE